MAKKSKATKEPRGRGETAADTDRDCVPSPSSNGRGAKATDHEDDRVAPTTKASGGVPGRDHDGITAPARRKSGRGARTTDTESDRATAGPAAGEGDDPPDTEVVGALSRSLQELKRRRDLFLKMRILVVNGLTSAVANVLGYRSGMTETEREKHWDEARTRVENIVGARGEESADTASSAASLDDESGGGASGDSRRDTDTVFATPAPVSLLDDNLTVTALVTAAEPFFKGKRSFDDWAAQYEKQMVRLARQLPVWPWVEQIRGVSALTLANIIGETGDLNLYANPGKIWRRMGCAPFEKRGEVHTGKAWKVGGSWTKQKLSAEEWETFAYCGRRRSVVYNLTASIKRACCGSNRDKPGADNEYVRRYDEVKLRAKEVHPDWTPIHVENHALLLMGKRFLRDLWQQWRKVGDK